ncbi:galactoside 2-alpha-L-fucosyltransferase 2-like [Pelobates cultripes]|uniref:L-Fucosyltransferase n=1 Tax=Pelobates cultripes TaxID=61616 RepID=A0AAD1T4D6_PELCU|nr:galactoside 2-alpha-L-fucosyltransferase 2-like [Pelobates cultripes]
MTEYTIGIVTQAQLEQTMVTVATKPPHSGMMTVNPDGRLGNVIGEYAILYALARLNGHQAYILPVMHEQLSKIFKIRLPVVHKDVANRINWTDYKIHYWMLPEYKNIQGEYVKLTGHPCSWTYYQFLKDEILKEFSFHEWIKEESYAYLTKVRGNKKNVTFVGVHVRRGDYVYIMPAWKGVVADKDYLQKAMDYFRSKYQNPIFVVTSNGMDWCKENIDNSLGDVHFAGDGIEGSPARDFALLAHCNHTIMTIGTFGYWIGYLAGGETVYLANYSLSHVNVNKRMKNDPFVLPGWIGIPANISHLL